MLKAAGCQDIKIDNSAKTATVKVPASMPMDKLTGSVSGKFSATVQQ
ncbi:MAG: hypothetical protein AAGD14_00715 [Planctomycetota bacterium]